MTAPFDKTDWDPLVTFAQEQIAVGTTAIGFTAATFAPSTGPARRAVVIVSSGAVRFSSAGSTTLTSAVGMPLDIGDQYVFWGRDILTAKFVQQTAAGTLDVEYAR